MKTTFAIAALATLISAPAFAGGVTANEWFKSQLEADNNYSQLAQVENGERVLIGTKGSAGALQDDARLIFEADDHRTLAASIAKGDVSGSYTTNGFAGGFPKVTSDND
ncbi:hypothetical protein IV417_05385 [Alphaproteobacteria bacterium KMM 3653]|uniref:Uncharacterized protein n=1 Tax=Harenicola maris TaxID=2841044 RepID=A0AAP2CPD4_9RHOB|nr:hypothetical protein [Harenicola maris]MBT0956807.1 hypothetical protein [Harenicola maris]MBT0956808.1 hypothetical protein [Harenicola maris]